MFFVLLPFFGIFPNCPSQDFIQNTTIDADFSDSDAYYKRMYDSLTDSENAFYAEHFSEKIDIITAIFRAKISDALCR